MENYKLSITQWALEDRPREKLLTKGISALSDAELIAILIGSGTRNETAVELAQRILNNSGNNLHTLGKLNVSDLMKEKGIGEAKAITIISALELGRRRSATETPEKSKITSSRDVFTLMHPVLGDLPHEEFWVLYLNRSNKIIDKMKISQGGVTGTVTDIKIIMKMALDKLALAVILCHNHPSGNTEPSQADIDITSKIKAAGTFCDVAVLDHIIIADKKYTSLADEGII